MWPTSSPSSGLSVSESDKRSGSRGSAVSAVTRTAVIDRSGQSFGEAIKAKMDREETWRERGAENDSTISPTAHHNMPLTTCTSLDQAKLIEAAGRTRSWGKMGPRDEGRRG
jgi:hypothetical protein